MWLHTNSRLKSKICCFPDRRGRRSLQAKNQAASTRRCGVEILSLSGRRVLVATRSRSGSNMPPACYSSPSRRFATSTPTINAPVVSKRKVAKDFRLFRGGRTQFAPTIKFFTISIRRCGLNFLPVGGDVLDAPRRKSVCFACGYIPIAV